MASQPTLFVFTTAYHPLIGGAELAVAQIARRLSSEFAFVIVTARFERRLPRREVRPEGTVIRVGFGTRCDKFLLPFLGTLRTLALMRTIEPSLFWPVMVSYASGIPYIINAVRFWRRPVPVLLTLQEGDSEAHIAGARCGLIALSWRAALRRADYLHTISTFLKSLAERYGYIGHTDVIPNGVAVKDFGEEHSPAERAALRRELGIGDGAKVVVTVSRLTRKNGVDTLLRAFRVLAAGSAGPFSLLVVGDGEERRALEALASELGIREQARFVGSVPYADVPHYLALADVFCRPSRSEGLGSAFLDAMAAGLPVVATPVGGIPDFLEDGVTGLVCQPDDPADCARKLERLLSDAPLRQAIADRAAAMVRERYSWDHVSAAFRTVFHRAIAAASRPSVLIATGIFPPDIGGPATYSALMARELPGRGIRTALLTYGPRGISRRIPKGLRHLCYFAACLCKAWQRDIVFAQDPLSAGLPALAAARLLRRRFVIRLAGDYAWEQSTQRCGVTDSIDVFQERRYGFPVEAFRAIQRCVARRADAVVAPSRYFGGIVRGWGVPAERINVIYNGITLDPAERCPDNGRSDARCIVSAGRLVPWKGFATLIEVLRDLPGWRLVIVGEGPERKNLESRIQNLELGERVRITGALQQAAVLRELCAASVFVLNTSFESFSFQVVQAMHAGVPVVTTAIGSLPEIIDDGQDGLLLPPNDRPAIAAAVRRLAGDQALRTRIVSNAREKAKRFSLEATAGQLIALFERIRPWNPR